MPGFLFQHHQHLFPSSINTISININILNTGTPTVTILNTTTTTNNITTTSMSWDQLIDDRARALEQTRPSSEQLPAYSEAMEGKSPAYVNVTEKELSERQRKHQKTSSKKSTFKSILTGEAHDHHRYVLEQSLTSERYHQRSEKPSPKPTSKGTSSTLRTILTGEAHNHHRRVLEASLSGERSTTASPQSSASPKPSSTLKSILTGDARKQHLYRVNESLDARLRSDK